MVKSIMNTKFKVGDKVVITHANLKTMVDDNKVSDVFIKKARQFLFAENNESNIGKITHTYTPGYGVTVWFRKGHSFQMGDSYITRVDMALPELFDAETLITLNRYDHDRLFSDMLNATSFDGFDFEIPDWEGRLIGDLSRHITGVRATLDEAKSEPSEPNRISITRQRP